MFIGFCNNFSYRKEFKMESYFNLFLLLTWFVGTFSLSVFVTWAMKTLFLQTHFSFLVLVHFSISFAKNPPDFHQSFTIIIISLHFFGKGFTLSKNCVTSSGQHFSGRHCTVCCQCADPCVWLAYLLTYKKYPALQGSGSPSFLWAWAVSENSLQFLERSLDARRAQF